MAPLAASNPRIRRLRRLSGRRSARVDEGAFLLEGPVLVAEALARDAPLEALYVEAAAAELPVVEAARGAGVDVHVVADGVLSDITDVVTPRPLLAVARRLERSLDAVMAGAVAAGRPVVVLVDVRDPGNLGTILRAAEASGAAGVVCTKGTVDPWSPKAVRSSAGAALHVPLVSEVAATSALAALGERGIRRIGTVVDAGRSHDELDLTGAVAVVLGSEAHGLDTELVDALDDLVTIPMEGRAESLNVAMAASVLCFEALRQRRRTGRETEPSASQPIGRPQRPTTR